MFSVSWPRLLRLPAAPRQEQRRRSRGPQIVLGPPTVVSRAAVGLRKNWGPWQFPSIQRLPDGRLKVGFHVAEDSATAFGVPPSVAVSEDDGKSWKSVAPGQVPPSWTTKILVLPNGDLFRSILLRSRKFEDVREKLPPPLAARTGGYGQKLSLYLAEKVPKELAGWRFARLAKGSDKWVEETAEVNIPGEVRTVTEGVLVFPWIQRIRIVRRRLVGHHQLDTGGRRRRYRNGPSPNSSAPRTRATPGTSSARSPFCPTRARTSSGTRGRASPSRTSRSCRTAPFFV